MESWISSVRSRSNELKAAGGNVTEEDILITLVGGLPTTYNHLLPNIDNLPPEDANLAHLTPILLAAEITHNTMHPRSVATPKKSQSMTTSCSTSQAVPNVAFSVAEIRCYFCDELGHTKANCLERKAWLEGKEKKIGQANAAIDMDNSDGSDFDY
ncbi:hypothetical protein K435DRAFT_702817 [Dendrothele bispora CBS 962.96]|uniref:CCHC-type domain-containing protein n=1 Tax=Dendrothele bispora (strain CBS 962.96) TaxID=1314807 RepID=A0A4S8KNY6_DENBC|nr:hypothetical protein K435DRAFT_702817 [Dendrothele bispora CBS 962.96]